MSNRSVSLSSPTKPGGLAERTRNVTLQFRIEELASSCNTSQGEVLSAVRGTVKATTKNFHGEVDTAQSFTFEFPKRSILGKLGFTLPGGTWPVLITGDEQSFTTSVIVSQLEQNPNPFSSTLSFASRFIPLRSHP